MSTRKALLLFIAWAFTSHGAIANPDSVAAKAAIKLIQVQSITQDLNPEVLKLAVQGYKNAKQRGLVKNQHLTIIDYSLPSNKRRLWVIDMKNNKLDYHLHVTHGKNSGLTQSTKFSNKPNSKASSLGTFITENSYNSKKVGFALRLKGLDKGFNDNALSRGVVMHGARYANKPFLDQHGRLGRSWGCPAVKQKVHKPLINHIKDGSVVFKYYPQQTWLASRTATHQV